MSTIYELKNQIFNQIVDETNKIAVNNAAEACHEIFNYNTQNVQLNSALGSHLNLELLVHSINIESVDAKNYHYSIKFDLLCHINNEFYKTSEKTVYNVLERVLKVIHAMDFYYCYKINNHNIKTKTKSKSTETTEDLNNKTVVVSWITNLSLDNNWLN